MENINIAKLQKLVSTLESIPNYRDILKDLKQKYKKRCFDQELSAILQKSIRINERQQEKITGKIQQKQKETNHYFAFEELKIFCWVIGVFCYLNGTTLASLNQTQIAEIQTIFSEKKSRLLIKYEIQNMIHKSRARFDWAQEQIELLNDIMQYEDAVNEWKLISLELFVRSNGKYLRPAYQCRQKWVNYLNPNIHKLDWTTEEDIQLLESVELIGRKWATISRDLYPQRNEHCIKNRYNSLIAQWKKKHQKSRQHKILEAMIKNLKSKRSSNSTVLGEPIEKVQRTQAQIKIQVPFIEPIVGLDVNIPIQQENSDMIKTVGVLQIKTDDKIVEQEQLAAIDEGENEEYEEFDIHIEGNIWLENQEKCQQKSKQKHHYHKITAQFYQLKVIDKVKEEKKTADQEDGQFQQPIMMGFPTFFENRTQHKPLFNFQNYEQDDPQKFQDWWQGVQQKNCLNWMDDEFSS